ncbi:SpaH/EbpB family LPXTG-anchored major pilin [Corynebacterium jeddahense]|uniref:Fimbrial subunit type 1 n=1 Tax=Corynebacterium jeddahense TaxID=1414719 RepID=A0ABY7UG19_9CORY|nr:SpaH/EbpB family LPXTG-anchored major pilin [Corynebacterium jeddahense]WCZ37686.1 Fimbrial subunit type 1 precursor [Corynebacterium jeddahense]
MNTFKRSLVASVAAGVILAGGAAPVFAQTPAPTTVGAAGIPVTQDQINSLVRTNKDEANLTIHKYSHKLDGSEKNGNGEALTPAPTFNIVKGAQYKIERIDADLKTNEGWRKASKIAAGTERANVIDIKTGEKSRTVTTGENGDVTTTLPLGLYRVTELAAPGHEINATPFYVTLPMTNVKGDAWNYDVHVYPKNTPDDRKLFTKDVKDANSHAFVSTDSYDTSTPAALVKGNNVTYPISSRVENGTLEYYRIEDHFDGTRLRQRTAGDKQQGETALVTNVRVTDENNKSLATLSAGDYGVSLENTGTANAFLAVELTPQGLAKLNGTTGQRRLAFEFNAELVEIGDKEAALKSVDNTDLRLWQRVGDNPPTTPNTPVTTTPPATNTPPTSSTPATNTPPPGTTTPTPFTQSYYGNVKIQKQNNEGGNLKGAKFELFKCTKADDGKLTLDQKTGALGSATSGEGGLAYFSGVHANSFVDNKAVDAGNNGYCIVETQAPRVAVVDAQGKPTGETSNYELLAQPVFFQVIADTKNNTVPLTVIKTNETVNQPEKGGFKLPFTGGNGAFWILGLGVLSLLVALGAQEKRRRQSA